MKAMIEACEKAGLERILVIGGSGAAHVELREALLGTTLDLRVIDGLNASPTKRTAAPDLAWAQLMVVWASTQLPHRVSQAFTEGRPRELPTHHRRAPWSRVVLLHRSRSLHPRREVEIAPRSRP